MPGHQVKFNIGVGVTVTPYFDMLGVVNGDIFEIHQQSGY